MTREVLTLSCRRRRRKTRIASVRFQSAQAQMPDDRCRPIADLCRTSLWSLARQAPSDAADPWRARQASKRLQTLPPASGTSRMPHSTKPRWRGFVTRRYVLVAGDRSSL